ncbi:MAG: hypothetical protein ACYTGX_04575 [Planctomycetota bacterium]|jgi:hypothetical protein
MRFLITTTAAACLLAGAAAAQDAKTYALDAKEKYEVGDVYTDVQNETSENHVVASVQGQVVHKQDEETTTTYTRVTKVLEVDDKGRETKVLVYFKQFAVKKGGFDDDTLTGKVIEITAPAGGTASWRHHSGPGNIATTAVEWLNGQMSSWRNSIEEEKAERAFKPKQPVQVGGTWTPDLTELMKSIGMPADEKNKPEGTCTLTKVETRDGVELAHITMQAKLPVGGMPGPGGAVLPWSKGGTMAFTHKGTMPTSARLAAGEEESTFSLEGEADMQGALVSLTVKGSEKSTRTLGGEIPELEKIPADQAKHGKGEDEKEGAEGEEGD